MIPAPIVNRWSYTADGVTVAFAYTGKIFEASDLTVLVDGEEVVTGFTITGLLVDTGGQVVFDVAPADEAEILLVRQVALKQPEKLPTNGALRTRAIENVLDRAVLVVARLEDTIGRVLRLDDADPLESLATLPIEAPGTPKYLGRDASGNLVWVTGSGTATPISAAMEPPLAAATTDLALAALGATATGIQVLKAADLAALKTYLGISTALLDRRNQLRLTLTSGTPVTTNDVTGASTLILTPFDGNQIALYYSGAWIVVETAEVSLALTLTAGKPYDVWAHWSGSAVVLTTTEWTDDNTRATALTTQDGVLVKTGDATKRYLGTLYASGTNQTEDSFAKRYLWNYYNRRNRPMRVIETTDSWAYTTAAWRQARGAAGNQLDFIVGVPEEMVTAEVRAAAANTNAGVVVLAGIATEANTTAIQSGCLTQINQVQVAGQNVPLQASYSYFPAAGRRRLIWLEYSAATGTTTWVGDASNSGLYQCGIFGRING